MKQKNLLFSQMDESKWDHIMNVNLKSAMCLTQMVVPSMAARGGGAVTYISSSAGTYRGLVSIYEILITWYGDEIFLTCYFFV